MKAKQHSDVARPSPRGIGQTPKLCRITTRVWSRIQRRRDALAIGSGRPWLIGFSHGVDSTVLLTALAALRATASLPPLVAVHIDHGLQPSSATTAQAARAAAARLDIACLVHSAAVAAPGGETAARAARLGAFARIARETQASAILLAHHRDDALETVLFRLMRGTGPLGLRAIPELRALDRAQPDGPMLFRPMLAIPKVAICSAARSAGLAFLEDPTNADPDHTPRNRIRHEILPELRRRDPQDRALVALVREAARLERATERELAGLEPVVAGVGLVELCVRELTALSPFARERHLEAALRLLDVAVPPRSLLTRLAALAEARVGKRVEARGRWHAIRARNVVRILRG